MKHPIPEGMRVVLASKSPRRKELMEKAGYTFTVLTKETDESYPPMMHPRDAVRFLSEKKARAVREETDGNTLIVASDTLVERDGKPLGKPRDREEAREMLVSLSGRHHNVHTGVCVILGEKMLSATDTTDVFFLPISDGEIEAYIETGEPMDKAGAYGIQGKGGKLISHINGHLDTVIGLPCELLDTLIGELLGNGTDNP